MVGIKTKKGKVFFSKTEAKKYAKRTKGRVVTNSYYDPRTTNYYVYKK